MAVNIILHSETAGHVPSALEPGQIAINSVDGIFYWTPDGTVIKSFNFLLPTVPTKTSTDNSTAAASTAFVQAIVTALDGGAPSDLSTLNALAAAINNDPNFWQTTSNALVTRVRFDQPQTLSGAQLAQVIANIGLAFAIRADVAQTLSGAQQTQAQENIGLINALRFDVAQTLSGAQQTQAQTNLGLGGGTTGVVRYDTAQTLTTPQKLQAQQNIDLVPPMRCGRLLPNTATSIIFVPCNGDLIKIGGALYHIPAGGITANNTGCRANGASGSTLAAQSTYYVSMNAAGVLGFWLASLGYSHTPDSTAGNVGVEVIYDASVGVHTGETLVGMVNTNGAGQFSTSVTVLNLLSWFNKRLLSTGPMGWGNASQNSGWAPMSAIPATPFLTWATHAVRADLNAQGSLNGTSGGYGAFALYDSTQFGPIQYVYNYSTPDCFTIAASQFCPEGYNSMQIYASTSTGGGIPGTTVTLLNPHMSIEVWG